ncbi:hypothetical protein [Stakelama saccharophila]|uniref:Uncharacterized protein n=1 Tax=Stakelama saccharophila TaxID=3075605 RepID=A0ABZ0B7V1_9SPHN|nr:hypothetical protein [Stakelama sp. W311]WNO53191.1 hypothetical protein RPR59_12155 [Stakelama sp. W311]
MNNNNIESNLLGQISATKAAIVSRLKELEQDHILMDHGDVQIWNYKGGNEPSSAWIGVRLQPGLGCTHTLQSSVTDDDGAWPIEPDELAGKFVKHAIAIIESNEAVFAARKTLKAIASKVVADAEEEGIDMEVLSIEPAALLIDEKADASIPQTFDVRLLMLGEDRGAIKMDAWTIDACNPELFDGYLRNTILPEQREFQVQLGKERQVA